MTVYVRTGRENIKKCEDAECAVLDTKDICDSVRFAVTKLDVRFSGAVTVRGRYNDSTSERVVIEGRLVNRGAGGAGALTIDLWSFDGASWQPVLTE